MSDDIQNLFEQVEKIDRQIKKLKAKRSELMRKTRVRFPQNDDVDKLVQLIGTTPGLGHKAIADAFSNMSRSDLTNLLVIARRNRGLIENRGTRSKPTWFLRGQQ